jgi:lysophospholipase L1-like esterase
MTIAVFEQISWAGSIARSRAPTESRLARVSEAEEMKTRLAAVHRRVRGTVSPGIKVNALARFDEDVLSHPRTDTVILMMGINDIGWPDSVLEPRVPAPSAEEIMVTSN